MVVGKPREEDVKISDLSSQESPFKNLLNMGQRFQPWHIYVMQQLGVGRLLSDRTLPIEARRAAATTLEQTGFGRHEDREGPLQDTARALLTDTLSAAVGRVLQHPGPASKLPHFPPSTLFCCPCCYCCAVGVDELNATAALRIASVKVLLNGAHWAVLGVLLCSQTPEAKCNDESAALSALPSSARDPSLTPLNAIHGFVVLGTIQQAREIAWSELESNLRATYEPVVRATGQRLSLSIPDHLPIFYAQGLQYGNQGCGFATAHNHELLLTGRFDVFGGSVQAGDRVEKQDGYDVMLLHESSGDVETRHLSEAEYELFQQGALTLDGEVLDSGRHRFLASYHDRSTRTPRTTEAALRAELFLELTRKWVLHEEFRTVFAERDGPPP